MLGALSVFVEIVSSYTGLDLVTNLVPLDWKPSIITTAQFKNQKS